MNKRNFFKSLALLAGAASISPQIFIPRFEPVIWKLIEPANEWVGEVQTTTLEAVDSVMHVRDRLHFGYPDLSACWINFNRNNHIAT